MRINLSFVHSIAPLLLHHLPIAPPSLDPLPPPLMHGARLLQLFVVRLFYLPAPEQLLLLAYHADGRILRFVFLDEYRPRPLDLRLVLL